VTTKERNEALPDVPAMAELSPASRPIRSTASRAPKGTPQEIVDKLNKDINAVLQEPKLKSRLADLGGTVLPARLRTSAPMSRARSTNGQR